MERGLTYPADKAGYRYIGYSSNVTSKTCGLISLKAKTSTKQRVGPAQLCSLICQLCSLICQLWHHQSISHRLFFCPPERASVMSSSSFAVERSIDMAPSPPESVRMRRLVCECPHHRRVRMRRKLTGRRMSVRVVCSEDRAGERAYDER